jgi:hypothetical protein
MKKFFLFVSFAVFTMAARAKIWRVNNNPGVVADATTAQSAHDLAAAGDTIHLEPSPTNYGNATCTKRLTWLSIGSFLTQNQGNQYSNIEAIASAFNMNAGSQGSIISVSLSSVLTINTDNISVIRSKVANAALDATTAAFNLTVSQSYFTTFIRVRGSNNVISNNICGNINVQPSASAVITGNIITDANGGNIPNSVFQNNIIISGTYTFTNSNISYNMTSGSTGLPADNGNIFNVSMASVFVNPGNASQRADKDFLLKPGSPAIGAGEGGIDMGAFGSSTPFVLGLQPAIPAITALVSPAASNASSIKITFSAKSNQ